MEKKKIIVRSALRVIVLFGILLLLAASVHGLALSGRQLGLITYFPGATITNHYSVSGTGLPVEVEAGADFAAEVSVSELIDGQFDLIIHFPEGKAVPPGSYRIWLTAKEVPPLAAGGAISSTVTVSKTFDVIVYSHEKDVSVSLSALNINEGNDVTFHLGVSSIGYPDIESVRGIIWVYGPEQQLLGEVSTEERPLPGLGGTTFVQVFESSSLRAGRYSAKATVFYDGKQKQANTTFLIGNMDVALLNYTSVLRQGFSEFEIAVANKWGNPLRNVYALLLVDGQELLQTPSMDLAPWEESTLSAIAKVDFTVGSHEGIVRIFFEGEQKDIPITLMVLPSLEDEAAAQLQEVKGLQLLPLGITIAILVAIVILLLWRKRSHDDDF